MSCSAGWANGDGARIDLAYQNLTTVPEKILRRHASGASILDLTCNDMQYLFCFVFHALNLHAPM